MNRKKLVDELFPEITWEKAKQELGKNISERRFLEIMLAIALDTNARNQYLKEIKDTKALPN